MKKVISFIIIFLLLTDAFSQIQSDKQTLDSLANHYMKNLLHYKGRKPVYNIQMSVLFKDKYEFHGAAGIIKKKETTKGEPSKKFFVSLTREHFLFTSEMQCFVHPETRAARNNQKMFFLYH